MAQHKLETSRGTASPLSAICNAPNALVANAERVCNAASRAVMSFTIALAAHWGGSHRYVVTQSMRTPATPSGVVASARLPVESGDGMGPMDFDVTEDRSIDIMVNHSVSGAAGARTINMKSSSRDLQKSSCGDGGGGSGGSVSCIGAGRHPRAARCRTDKH